MPIPGLLPGGKVKKFEKVRYEKHVHDVVHAACGATGAVYSTATSITSSTPKSS